MADGAFRLFSYNETASVILITVYRVSITPPRLLREREISIEKIRYGFDLAKMQKGKAGAALDSNQDLQIPSAYYGASACGHPMTDECTCPNVQWDEISHT